MFELYKEITDGFLNYCIFLSILFILAIWIGFLTRLICSAYMDEVVSKRVSKDPLVKSFMEKNSEISKVDEDTEIKN